MLSAKPAEVPPPSPSEVPLRAPLPSFFPFHIVPAVSNFRDIGGWPITPPSPATSSSTTPRHVRRGILFRGSDTSRITSAGIAKLQELNIQTDFDLRSKQQIEKAGGFKDMSEWKIKRLWTPVFSDEEYTEKKAKERYEMYASEDSAGIVEAFVEILTSGAPMISTVILHLLSTVSDFGTEQDAKSTPALFMHCTTGNNRTGVFISLLLLLLQVPPSYIVLEYTLSEQGLAPTRHINVERLLKNGAFVEYGPEEARRKCERMVGARGESMEALLEEVERRWGGADGYFRHVVGLSEAKVRRVREILTEEGE